MVVVRFLVETMTVLESSGSVVLIVEREGESAINISLQLSTIERTAKGKSFLLNYMYFYNEIIFFCLGNVHYNINTRITCSSW